MAENAEHIEVCCCDKDMKRLWAVPRYYDFFFEYDLVKNSICKTVFFPEEIGCEERLFGSMQYKDEKLIFTPVNSRFLVVYDLKEEIFLQYPLYEDENVYYNSYIDGDVVYMLSPVSAAMLMFSMTTQTISYDYSMQKMIGQVDKGATCFMTNYSENEDLRLYTVAKSNFLIEEDKYSDKKKSVKIGAESECFTMPVSDGENYWTVLYNSERTVVVRYIGQTGQTEYFDVTQDIPKCRNYMGGTIIGDDVYFFPSICGGKIICINKYDGTLKQFCLDESDEYFFSPFRKTDSGCWMYEIQSKRLFICEDGVWRIVQVNLDERYYKTVAESFRRRRRREFSKMSNRLLYENSDFSLGDYAYSITKSSKGKNVDLRSAGKEIFKIVSRMG